MTDGKNIFVDQANGEEFHSSFHSFSVSAVADDLIVCLVGGGCCKSVSASRQVSR